MVKIIPNLCRLLKSAETQVHKGQAFHKAGFYEGKKTWISSDWIKGNDPERLLPKTPIWTHPTKFPTNSTPRRDKLIKVLNSIARFQTMPPVSDKLPNVVFVLGGPGAGKGTQCTKIVETFDFVHLSAGDLLREERNKPGSEYGELIEKHIRDGTIVPVEITCSLIERAMNESHSSLFLIDGFPRNKNNLDGWESAMSTKVNVLFVLFFDAPEEVCVGRCLSRGQAGSGRSDDNPDSLKKRVNTYVNDTMPIVNYFVEKDLVHKVDASLTPDKVFEEVKLIFEGVLSPAS